MSSRNPPPSPSDSRYASRDRSPGFAGRRPSATYGGGSLAARITTPSQRPSDSHGYSSGGRDPPRGPKALLDGPRPTAYIPRGMRYPGRGESRGREFRAPVDGPGARRGSDRDWDRRDRIGSRERRLSPAGRNRSRSPLARDFRDVRDFPARDLDGNRVSRGARDAPLSASSSVSDALTSANPGAAGTFRGRSGLGWEHSKSSRANYPEERDGFRNRSWSRDRQWDKKGRDERDLRDYDSSRREDEMRKDGDERGRDIDRLKREVPSFRPESGNSSGAQVTPTTPVSASAFSAHPVNPERPISVEPVRRPPGPVVNSTLPGAGRETDRMDSLGLRAEKDRPTPRMRSPPPQAPEVPAFGSIPINQSGMTVKDHSKEEVYLSEMPRSTLRNNDGQIPSGPKPKPLSHVPSAPKAIQQQPERNLQEHTGVAEHKAETDRDRYSFGHLLSSANVRASNAEDPPRETRFETINGSSHLRGVNENAPSNGGTFSGSPGATRPKSLPATHQVANRNIEETYRVTPAPKLNMITPNKAAPYDTTNQTSPVKIPTGPRAERNVPTIRPPIPSPLRGPLARPSIPPRQSRPTNLKWVRPGLQTSRVPSIMNIVPTKRDYVGEEKQRNVLANRESFKSAESSRAEVGVKSDVVEPDPEAREEAEPPHAKLDVEMDEATDEAKAVDQGIEPPSPHMPISGIGKSSDTDMDVDFSLADFDDEEYAQEERKYELSMQALEAKRPATPRHHPLLLSLLDECDALASVAEDLSRTIDGAISGGGVSVESIPLGLPSPKLEENDKPSVEDHPTVIASPVKPGRQTPPVESLPFLTLGPPTPFSELEEIQQIPVRYDLIYARIVDILGNQREQMQSENEDIKVEFGKRYKQWRLQIEERQQLKKAENLAATAPGSPTPASLPLATPVEGRRTAKNTSEFDLERVLRESAVTAQEDQERRNREKNFIDLEKEAEIPQMLNRYEVEATMFVDRNNWIETHLVLDALGFIPPRDDFTPEEQEIFLESYLTNPKKWGTIAGALKGRDYQDCVRHYYHTKSEAQYKEKEKVFIRIRKGRKGVRGPQPRPKATALITPYDGAMEFEAPQVPVTDTGRPRRAAAPTFGDAVEGEVAPPTVTTPARRNATAAKLESNGEPPAEKPTHRRGRTASVKEKPPKKGKAPLIAAAPAPPPRNDGDMLRAKSREPKIEGDQRVEEIEGAQVLAGLQSSQPSLGVSQSGPSDTWLGVQPAPMNNPIYIPKPQQQQLGPDVNLHPPKGTQSMTSSYWSVPEQTDFQNLVQHFGTDWHAIAAHMKSKTHTMVCDLPCSFSIIEVLKRYKANPKILNRLKIITFVLLSKEKPMLSKLPLKPI